MSYPPPEVDPLQAALEEAANLMSALDTTDETQRQQQLVIQSGFSIDDDDDDDDDDKEDVPLDDNDQEPLHPLQDIFLSPTDPVVLSSHPTTTTPPYPSPHTSRPSSSPSSSSMLLNHLHTTNATTSTPSAASLDAFKAQTSRFASNLAHMAQRGLSQVASATTTAASSPFGMMEHAVPIVIPAHHYQNHQHQPGGGLVQQQPLLVGPPLEQQPQLFDNEQKATLIRTHVGELLSGERIIMFLSNLLYVADSTSGFSYSHMMEPTTVWCCAMTYYRLILFGTHHHPPPSSSSTNNPSCPPVDWNAACWPNTNINSSSGGGGGAVDGSCGVVGETSTTNGTTTGTAGTTILQIPLASMDRVEKSVFSAGPSSLMGLLITGKDNARQLRFTTPSYGDTLRAHEALQTYAFPGRRNLGYLFAFESKREAVMASIVTEDGTGKKIVMLAPARRRFDAVAEFQRQMARGGASHHLNRPWAVWTTINQSYQTCMSYPAVLVGPASLDESTPDVQRIVRQCAAFRSENRLPALTWTSGADGASLWRCSQPKIGLQGNRSSADELFLKHIMESAAAANALATTQVDHHRPILSRAMIVQLTGSPELQNWVPDAVTFLKILDLRPRSAAMANRTGGYGYENTSNYPGSTLQFCNIGNIHAVRDSYQKISALCSSATAPDLQWNAAVEDTKWLSHIRVILAASWEAVFWIQVHRLPVLLHCSHGWDRTSQVGVLAQLLLDPYYRTREGFSTLVEKDFLSFGHPFHTRCAHGEGRGEDQGTSGGSGGIDQGQKSPIFLQFLDCVFQIVNIYPECFEFNTKYLLIISEHIYSCRFGNFLCDTERERELVAGIRQRTHSLWDYLDSRADTLSTCYTAERASGVLLMPLPTLLRNVTFWSERHCMHGPKATLRGLPSGIARPEHPFGRDQQSALITVQENLSLIMAAANPATKEEQTSLEEQHQEEDFAISVNE
jgi:myotubularin-related protein 1/2